MRQKEETNNEVFKRSKLLTRSPINRKKGGWKGSWKE